MVCTLEKNATKTIQKALKTLGKKNFALIMHSGSFPSAAGENTGFGTVNSNGGKEVIDFASGIFNSIQLGPAGKTKGCDASPYTGTIFSGNPLFIDLKQLTEKKWHYILSVETYNEIVEGNPNKHVNKTAYSYIYNKQAEALLEAWNNFKKLDDKKLNKAFNDFKRENDYWLDKDSLYEALSIEHGNDYWPLWDSETDKNLFNPKSIEEGIEYGKRIEEISKKYSDEIECYKFIQFVLDIQNQETLEYAKKNNIKMIADRQVAFSDRDTWAYQSLFLDGWMLGCPPDYFSKDGQAWGFPVMNPEKLFKADGSLDSIVEAKDATDEQKAVKEINAGAYCLNWSKIKQAFSNLKTNNAQGEYYLTDIVKWANDNGLKANVYTIKDKKEIFGINSKTELAEASKYMNERTIKKHLDNGVQIIDPSTTWISPETEIEHDTVIYPSCYINGKNKIGAHCKIGPFAHLRGDVVLEDYVKIGNFVEVKKSKINSNTNAGHLSYIGDSEIGEHVNIGAGTITANYNPITKVKSKTILHDNVKVGSTAVLVASVELQEWVNVGAGSVITKNVEKNSLALTRSPLRVIKDWVKNLNN